MPNRFVVKGMPREFKELIVFEEAENGKVVVDIVSRDLPASEYISIYGSGDSCYGWCCCHCKNYPN